MADNTLYDIAKEIEFFNYQFDEETGEFLNAEELDNLKMNFNDKVENVCLFIKNLESMSDMMDAEITALKARKDAKDNKANRLKEYLKYCLKGETFETPRCSVTYRKSTETIIPDDLSNLPPAYVTEVTTLKADKKAIAKAIDGGIELEGCSRLVKYNLQLK